MPYSAMNAIPPVEVEARKTRMLRVRLSEEEARAVHQLARQVHAPTLSQAVRHVLRWAAEQQAKGNVGA